MGILESNDKKIHYTLLHSDSKSRENKIKYLEKNLDVLNKSGTRENDKVRSQHREFKARFRLTV